MSRLEWAEFQHLGLFGMFIWFFLSNFGGYWDCTGEWFYCWFMYVCCFFRLCCNTENQWAQVCLQQFLFFSVIDQKTGNEVEQENHENNSRIRWTVKSKKMGSPGKYTTHSFCLCSSRFGVTGYPCSLAASATGICSNTFTRTITSSAYGSMLGQWKIWIYRAVLVFSYEFAFNDPKSGKWQ